MTSPPRLARWVVTTLVDEPMREFLLGDLDEQFADAVRDQGPGRARRQYWSQSLRSIAPPGIRGRRAGAAARGGGHVRNGWSGRRISKILRSPGYSAITLLTLALAVGANTLLFSIANPLVLRPLPIEDPDRLGWIQVSNPERGLERSPASLPDFLEWRRMTSFTSLAAYERRSGTLTGHGDAKRIQAAHVTADLFDVWGAAEEGRCFNRGDRPAVLVGS